MRGLRRRPPVAIVHDYLTQRGGAERVVLSMARAFPEAPIVTSLYAPDATFPEFADHRVMTGPLDRVTAFRADHRRALPVLAPAFSRTVVDADVALCSSSGWAHGVRTTGRKIVYCHNPARWLYQADEYLEEGPSVRRTGLAMLRRPLERWDRTQAGTADTYLANSSVVRRRILDTYGIDAEVVPPPVSVDTAGRRESVPGVPAGFALCVSRLLPYKHVAEVAQAFHGMNTHLVVVGRGPQEQAIRAVAPDNVHVVGSVAEAQLRWLYANASVLVAASYEDFGLTPVEAGAFGTPAVVLRRGGYLDTTVEGVTGEYFDAPTPSAIRRAVVRAQARSWDPDRIRQHARRFSEQRFIDRLHAHVAGPEVAHRGGPERVLVLDPPHAVAGMA